MKMVMTMMMVMMMTMMVVEKIFQEPKARSSQCQLDNIRQFQGIDWSLFSSCWDFKRPQISFCSDQHGRSWLYCSDEGILYASGFRNHDHNWLSQSINIITLIIIIAAITNNFKIKIKMITAGRSGWSSPNPLHWQHQGRQKPRLSEGEIHCPLIHFL